MDQRTDKARWSRVARDWIWASDNGSVDQSQAPFMLNNFAGLYILEFRPPPVGGGSKVLEMKKEINGGKREKKEIWGKYNFLQY